MNLRRTVKPEKKAFAKALRNHQTLHESTLWERLRRDQLGSRFRRQVIIRGWIVDFWCPAKRLVVEVDGASHKTPEGSRKDAHRDSVMRGLGLRVLRVDNEEIDQDLGRVISKIQSAIQEST